MHQCSICACWVVLFLGCSWSLLQNSHAVMRNRIWPCTSLPFFFPQNLLSGTSCAWAWLLYGTRTFARHACLVCIVTLSVIHIALNIYSVCVLSKEPCSQDDQWQSHLHFCWDVCCWLQREDPETQLILKNWPSGKSLQTSQHVGFT